MEERLAFSSGNELHYGLKPIYTDVDEINISNIAKIVEQSLPIYKDNRKQILELKSIYCGKQAILSRTNDISDINEKVNLNILPTLITTVAGLWLGEKIDYVLDKDDIQDQDIKDIKKLNKILRNSGDILCDKHSLIDILISGVSYQFCGGDIYKDIKLRTLKSEDCFSIRSNRIGNDIILTGIYSNLNNIERITCFTQKEEYNLVRESGQSNFTIESKLHLLPENPLQEIKANEFYLSMVAQLEAAQNAFNVAISDTINGIISQIRSILLITGGELTDDNVQGAKKNGILNVVAEDGRNVTGAFLQKPIDDAVNKLREDLFDLMIFIAGLPSNNVSTSGNNGAVLFGGGYYTANQNAYFNELEFKLPKQNIIENTISLLKQNGKIKGEITSEDIEIRFDRTRLTSLLDNANALSLLISSGMPIKDSIKVTGIFNDVDRVAEEAKKIIEEKVKQELSKDIKITEVKDNDNKEDSMS